MPDETATPELLVEDSATELTPGQMRKSEFLTQLRSAVSESADEALRATGRTAEDCPYIEYWFGYYENKDSRHIEDAVHRYAPETRRATRAGDYIPLIAARVRRSVDVWARTGEVIGLPEGMPLAAPG